jgi:putative SOS response-associated peptidase YedK
MTYIFVEPCQRWGRLYFDKIHDRMRVILGKDDEKKWLYPANQNVVNLKKMLIPCPQECLTMYEVSPLLNSTKVKSKEVLASMVSSELV